MKKRSKEKSNKIPFGFIYFSRVVEWQARRPARSRTQTRTLFVAQIHCCFNIVAAICWIANQCYSIRSSITGFVDYIRATHHNTNAHTHISRSLCLFDRNTHKQNICSRAIYVIYYLRFLLKFYCDAKVDKHQSAEHLFISYG